MVACWQPTSSLWRVPTWWFERYTWCSCSKMTNACPDLAHESPYLLHHQSSPSNSKCPINNYLEICCMNLKMHCCPHINLAGQSTVHPKKWTIRTSKKSLDLSRELLRYVGQNHKDNVATTPLVEAKEEKGEEQGVPFRTHATLNPFEGESTLGRKRWPFGSDTIFTHPSIGACLRRWVDGCYGSGGWMNKHHGGDNNGGGGGSCAWTEEIDRAGARVYLKTTWSGSTTKLAGPGLA